MTKTTSITKPYALYNNKEGCYCYPCTPDDIDSQPMIDATAHMLYMLKQNHQNVMIPCFNKRLGKEGPWWISRTRP